MPKRGAKDLKLVHAETFTDLGLDPYGRSENGGPDLVDMAAEPAKNARPGEPDDGREPARVCVESTFQTLGLVDMRDKRVVAELNAARGRIWIAAGESGRRTLRRAGFRPA